MKNNIEFKQKVLNDKQKEMKESINNLKEGKNVKSKKVVVKKLKDGITISKDKNGNIIYLDKNGKVIEEKDAFREVTVEVPDDGDNYGEYEEVIDPKTGKKIVRKKQIPPTIKIDPKTGKQIKTTTKVVYEEVIDPKTGKKKKVKVEYEEVIDENGNIKLVKKSVDGKPVVDNKKIYKGN